MLILATYPKYTDYSKISDILPPLTDVLIRFIFKPLYMFVYSGSNQECNINSG